MKLYFHIGSPDRANTVTFWEIIDKSQLETIELITKNLNLSRNDFNEESYTVADPKGSYTAFKLTIYLPDYDENSKPFSCDFGYLFKHSKYSKWKEMIIAKFPEVSDKFYIAEKETKSRQELYRAERQLQSYRDATKPFSFHLNDEYLQSLQQRITELRHEVFPRAPLAKSLFDYKM